MLCGSHYAHYFYFPILNGHLLTVCLMRQSEKLNFGFICLSSLLLLCDDYKKMTVLHLKNVQDY